MNNTTKIILGLALGAAMLVESTHVSAAVIIGGSVGNGDFNTLQKSDIDPTPVILGGDNPAVGAGRTYGTGAPYFHIAGYDANTWIAYNNTTNYYNVWDQGATQFYLPGWTATYGGSGIYYDPENSPALTGDGLGHNYIGMENGNWYGTSICSMTNTTSATIHAGASYTFSIDIRIDTRGASIGNYGYGYNNGATPNFYLSLDAQAGDGTLTLLTPTTDTGNGLNSTSDGVWHSWTKTYSAADLAPYVGQTLVAVIGGDNMYGALEQVTNLNFDNMTLTEEVTETATLVMESVTRSNDDIYLVWSTTGGTTNAVQITAGDANGSYSTNGLTDVATLNIAGSGAVVTNYIDSGGATNTPARYYRVRLVP